jgi:hypothetical protein
MVITMATCSALGFVDPDAPKKDPEYSRAVSKGAKAKIELQVIDDEGVPVSNANVKVILGMVTTANILKGQTDTNGVFIIEGKTRGNEIIIQPKKDGYYNSEKKIVFWGKQRQVKNGKWQPYGEKVTVVLRKKKNPKLLVTDFYNTRFTKTNTLNQWIGFDIKENDFVKPHGNGKVADFEIYFDWDGEWGYSPSYNGVIINIRFIEPHTGYYEVDKILTSDFKWQYNAMTNNVYIQSTSYGSRRLENGEFERKLYDKGTYWVVRSRPVVDEKGNLISANYSIFYNIQFSCNEDKTVGILLSRVFNPTPNDTNLEPVDIPTSDGIRIRTFPDPNYPPRLD